ncbi:hypothetical protein SNE40_018030 [Patella caerulea]|uniref:peptidylprolyl isomerase n=1 Tax=Patella caerulea TaxID=87958 RepID=A0AAN8JCH7_PATCE
MASFKLIGLLLACVCLSFAEDELKIDVLEKPENCERLSKKFDMLQMHYTGTLEKDGSKFDSSKDHGQPFSFQLGVGQVIKGWDQGLTEMCVGEKRKLVIPSHLGYGESGAGESIPPNANLLFDVELVDIQDGQPPPNVFKEIDADGNQLLSVDEIATYLKEQASKHNVGEENVEEQHNNMIKEIMAHEDKDKDGFISHEEFSGPKHDEL